MGTHKIYSGIQGIRDNILGSLYGDCHELLALFYVLITWPWHVMEILDSLVTKQSCTSLRAHFKQLFNDETRDCTVHWSIAALKVFNGNLFANFDCLAVFTHYQKGATNSGTVYLCFFFFWKSCDSIYLQRFGECTLSNTEEGGNL